jgi:hypothetical protein
LPAARAGNNGNAAPAAAVPKILRRDTFILILLLDC